MYFSFKEWRKDLHATVKIKIGGMTYNVTKSHLLTIFVIVAQFWEQQQYAAWNIY